MLYEWRTSLKLRKRSFVVNCKSLNHGDFNNTDTKLIFKDRTNIRKQVIENVCAVNVVALRNKLRLNVTQKRNKES